MELRTSRVQLASSLLSVLLIIDCILLICLFCRSFLDHTVCVNTKRGLIIESCKPYSQECTLESLIACAENEKVCRRIDEKRELVESEKSRP